MDGFSILILSVIGVFVGAALLVFLLLRSSSKDVQRRAWERERQFEGGANARTQAMKEQIRQKERERRQANIRRDKENREKRHKEQKAKTMF